MSTVYLRSRSLNSLSLTPMIEGVKKSPCAGAKRIRSRLRNSSPTSGSKTMLAAKVVSTQSVAFIMRSTFSRTPCQEGSSSHTSLCASPSNCVLAEDLLQLHVVEQDVLGGAQLVHAVHGDGVVVHVGHAGALGWHEDVHPEAVIGVRPGAHVFGEDRQPALVPVLEHVLGLGVLDALRDLAHGVGVVDVYRALPLLVGIAEPVPVGGLYRSSTWRPTPDPRWPSRGSSSASDTSRGRAGRPPSRLRTWWPGAPWARSSCRIGCRSPRTPPRRPRRRSARSWVCSFALFPRPRLPALAHSSKDLLSLLVSPLLTRVTPEYGNTPLYRIANPRPRGPCHLPLLDLPGKVRPALGFHLFALFLMRRDGELVEVDALFVDAHSSSAPAGRRRSWAADRPGRPPSRSGRPPGVRPPP